MSDFFSLSAKERQNFFRMYEQFNNINKLASSRNNLSLEDSEDDGDEDTFRSPAIKDQSADTTHSLPEADGFSSEEDTVCSFLTG